MPTRDALGQALELLRESLRPYVERELQRAYAARWQDMIKDRTPRGSVRPDVQVLLAAMCDHWSVFRGHLGHAERALVSELRETRNRWAHQEPFTVDDTYRALDSIERLLTAIGSDRAAQLRLRKKALLSEGRDAAEFAPTRRRRMQRVTRDRPATFELLVEAFRSELGERHRLFGSRTIGVLGICDANEGAQWNAWVVLKDGVAWLGVNLEGIAYDGWPVARLIERELEAPMLPDIASRYQEGMLVEVSWMRDCWRAASRPAIQEANIPPTPIPLARLTADSWRRALAEAQQCLDASRAFRGRGRQRVTLLPSGREEELQISPHLQFRLRLWDQTPKNKQVALARIRQSRKHLEGTYEFVSQRSRK